ncbi:AraC-type DNA-binding protein [Cyclonatronum proteinivorum]|uniref:AraC-type DNA-binding protein n=1 Tax=Cyclonatronum proteinivorum TaxID=1457365 RepID=A0A345UGD4_9BACT|nr:helix-turn-helix transcriptional regulator [Cyclonatronum proteinivorum]AXI99535.1 AraC-type DNA-binding protein [Cyclonatronum proteinivorum]
MKIIHIKNMVCPRCVEAVRQTLSGMQLKPDSVSLGKTVFSQPLQPEQLGTLEEKLKALGFELIRPEAADLPAQIRSAVIRYQQLLEEGKVNGLLSAFLGSKLHKNYSYLSEQFSRAGGQTITQYHEKLRTERAKELLELGQLSVGEIALTLGYSSSQHFSGRFREQTGYSPTAWREKGGPRKSLDAI